MKNIVAIIVGLTALLFCVHQVRERMAENAEIEKHNAVVNEFNACLNAGDWNCAEKGLQIMLAKTPDDKSLQKNMAGVLFQQERYEECIAYISGLNFADEDMEHLSEKSKALIREMQTLELERSAHFRLEFEGRPSRGDVLEALSVLEVAYDSLCRLFDFYPENKMQVVLYQTSDYSGVGPRPDWVGALFDGKLRIPVNVMQYREIYRPMLFHELTHAFVRAMTHGNIPTWLNEGIAQIVDASRNGVEHPAGPSPTLAALAAPFVNENNSDNATKLYWYSQKMVEGMLRRQPSFAQFKGFVQSLKSLDIDAALNKFYGVTARQLLNEI